jgi:hypothetical protein
VAGEEGHRIPGGGAQSGGEAAIALLGQVTVVVTGETHRLVTFLNQTLKDQDLIFGLSRGADGGATFTVYQVRGGK